MTIAELGAIGEFVSAIAILVTLVYLAIQTKNANVAARINARQTVVTEYNALNLANFSSSDPGLVRRAILGSDKLDQEDQDRFDSWLRAYSNSLIQISELHDLGLIDDVDWEHYAREAAPIVSCKAARNIYLRGSFVDIPLMYGERGTFSSFMTKMKPVVDDLARQKQDSMEQ